MSWFDVPVVVLTANVRRVVFDGGRQGRGVHQDVEERKRRNRDMSRRYQARMRRERRVLAGGPAG